MAFVVRIMFAPGSDPAYLNSKYDTTYRAKKATRFCTRQEAERAAARCSEMFRFGVPFLEPVPDGDAGGDLQSPQP